MPDPGQVIRPASLLVCVASVSEGLKIPGAHVLHQTAEFSCASPQHIGDDMSALCLVFLNYSSALSPQNPRFLTNSSYHHSNVYIRLQ